MHNLPVISMKKGQILMWDLMFGLLIFFVALALTINMWDNSYYELRYAEEDYEMNWLADTIAEQLVRTTGEPKNWMPQTAIAYGLVETNRLGYTKSRVLDADKILYLIDSFDKNYTLTRNNLLGSSKYEIYIQLICVNQSGLECLQGLPLDRVKNTVFCNNKAIRVTGDATSSYIWLEAEDLWGNGNNESCDKGCSKGNMSVVDGTPEVSVKTSQGTYMIWVRTLEEGSEAKIVIDGAEHAIHKLGLSGLLGWNWVGEQELSSDTVISFKDALSTTEVDAVLLTTDALYDPRYEHPDTFGNPNNESVCIIGDEKGGAEIVMASRTGIIGLPVGRTEIFESMQAINQDIIDIKVMLWKGQALTPRNASETTTTTTTIVVKDSLSCAGEPTELCVQDEQWISIENITLWDEDGNPDNTLVCGQKKDVTVYWRGKHLGDPNYFGFFIKDNRQKIGACESNNIDGESGGTIYGYYMNYSFTPESSAIKLPDGTYDFIVTADDFGGYCNSSDPRADDEKKVSINLRDCIQYTPLTCATTGGFKFDGCNNLSDTITKVYTVEVDGGQLLCDGNTDTVKVKFRGTHGDDKAVQWSFIVKDGTNYVCVGKCQSTVLTAEPTPQDYELICTLNLNGVDCSNNIYSISNGPHIFYVVPESYGNLYCAEPENKWAEAVGSATVNVYCGCEKYTIDADCELDADCNWCPECNEYNQWNWNKDCRYDGIACDYGCVKGYCNADYTAGVGCLDKCVGAVNYSSGVEGENCKCSWTTDDCSDCSCTCGGYVKTNEEGLCTDGLDNDCDGYTDRDDTADCSCGCSGTQTYITPDKNSECGRSSLYQDNPLYECIKAYDGLLTGGWYSSSAVGEEWIWFDLQQERCVSGIRFMLPYDTTKYIAVDVSDDKTTWTRVAQPLAYSQKDTWFEREFTEVNARYVKLTFSSTSSTCGIREAQIRVRDYLGAC